MKIVLQTILIIFLLSVSFAGDTDELQRLFLIASTPDHRLSEKREKAIAELSNKEYSSVNFLIDQLDRKEPYRREVIEQVILRIGHKAIKPLLSTLTSDNLDHAAFAAYLLGKLRAEKAIIPLMMAMQNSNRNLRAEAVRALGEIGDTTAFEPIVKALDDSIAPVRRNAAIALGKIGSPEANLYLLKAVSDSDFNVSLAATRAIAEIGDTTIADTLLEMIPKAETETMLKLLEILGELHTGSSLTALLSYTEHSDHLIRAYAYRALSKYRGDYRVVNAMKRGLGDNAPFVRMMSAKALREIRTLIEIRKETVEDKL